MIKICISSHDQFLTSSAKVEISRSQPTFMRDNRDWNPKLPWVNSRCHCTPSTRFEKTRPRQFCRSILCAVALKNRAIAVAEDGRKAAFKAGIAEIKTDASLPSAAEGKWWIMGLQSWRDAGQNHPFLSIIINWVLTRKNGPLYPVTDQKSSNVMDFVITLSHFIPSQDSITYKYPIETHHRII